MPLAPPSVFETRSYQEILDETVARIPVHNPEWTNFNASDPGITLIELFAHLTESLVYRANQIPERNRRKFLSLVGVPLAPATSAQGIVVIVNERGPQQTITLDRGVEVTAGQVSFHTTIALDVLPVEGQAYVKRPLASPAPQLESYYRQLYASYRGRKPDVADLKLYETAPLPAAGVDLGDTIDGSLWIALLLRPQIDVSKDVAREQLAGRTLSLGVVPRLDEPATRLEPAAQGADPTRPHLEFQLPLVTGPLSSDPALRQPSYRPLDASAAVDVLRDPGIVDIGLPAATELGLWEDLDPLEAGVGEFPPALEDEALADRVVTWLRIRAPRGAKASLLWAGINAATVSQRTQVAGEVLPSGNGEPDQSVRLANAPVIPETLRLSVDAEVWQPVDDMLEAGPEVPLPDVRSAPGTPPPPARESHVYVLDPESAIVRFGDGIRGRRPPPGAILRADYAYGRGRAGNVAAGAIATAPALPAGLKVSNPVRTWGGADGETEAEGEKQISAFLRHRDRAVTAEDFDAIVRRAPGADVGRVDVVPAYAPELGASAAGDAAGAVTLLLVPRYDAASPDAPEPDQAFLDAVCAYLDPRRLVTTEVFLRGPDYRGVWVSVGIDPYDAQTFPTVREAVKAELRAFLSPLEPDAWPRDKDVSALELQSVVARVPGVRLVRALELAGPDGVLGNVTIAGLALPRILGLSVAAGDAVPIARLRGAQPEQPPTTPRFVPVPVVPETC
jgi:hypothetical protein